MNNFTSKLQICLLSENAKIPTKGSENSAGFDLYSAYNYTILPGNKSLIKTDIAICLPPGTYGRIAPRSSIALKYHINIGAGVIDNDYRGNICVLLFNHSKEIFFVKSGDRIAQLICEKYECPLIEKVLFFRSETKRNTNGFGSSDNL